MSAVPWLICTLSTNKEKWKSATRTTQVRLYNKSGEGGAALKDEEAKIRPWIINKS